MAETASLRTVIAACLDGYADNHRLSPRQWQVCRHVLDCRTAALGGLVLRCDNCAEETPAYHACSDRHCPRCQRRATEEWCEKQRAAVLPVTDHHLVFTLPHVLNPWVEIHDRELYSLLFEAVWATLSAFGADPKRLDGQLGMTAVLHTWGQTLTRHVHLHCLVPGGALFLDGQWNPTKGTYLFPVRALSRHIRGGFVSRLRQAVNDGRLKRVKGAAQIDAMRIRHFGFLANRCQRQRLAQIRTSIKTKEADTAARTRIDETLDRPCPKCRKGRLRVVGEIAPRRRPCGHRSG